MNPELETYQDQLLSIRQDVPGILAGLDDRQFNWRPSPDRWSIGECLDHLNRSAALLLPPIEAATVAGRAAGRTASGPFAYGLVDRLFLWGLEPPPRLKIGTTRPLKPGPLLVRHEVEQAFSIWQERIAGRIMDADGLDLAGIRLRSPVLPVLRYSLGTALAGLLAHERRHVWQARAVRTHPLFPSG